MAKPEQQDANFRYFVRIANTDLDGNKQIAMSLTKVKGIGVRFAFVICKLIKLDPSKKTGTLSDEEIKRIDEVMKDPAKFKAPSWMFNRRKDTDTGEDKHLTTTDLIFITDNDLKMMKKMKSYKGVRHSSGLTVRGQRTKSNFRRNKGKLSIGVKKKQGK